ncbi:MAG: DUF4097 family beta strand repeat protein [Agathobacter sp.]|nr:DUF4097 family beta strand repeat protein [Agathobacter sp.]
MRKTMDVSNRVKELNIDIHYGELHIEKGETFAVEIECTERHEIFAEECDECLSIWGERVKKQFHITHRNSEHLEVKITIPEQMQFEKIQLTTGAVELDVDTLSTKRFVAKMGAGEICVGYLEVVESAQMEAGAGEIHIGDGKIKNLNMNLGAGEVHVKALMEGKSEINAGVGELNLVLLGNPDDYCATISKGLGSCSVNGFTRCNGNTYGDGEHKVKISGGIGAVNVSFE